MKKCYLPSGSVFFSEKKMGGGGENQKENEIPIISEKQLSFVVFLSHSLSFFPPSSTLGKNISETWQKQELVLWEDGNN